MILNELVKMSNFHGANEDLVLAGGGNTSAKDENTLYVKCSGTQLATMKEDGFVALDRKILNQILTKEYPGEDAAREAEFLADTLAARHPGEENKRPSVEALLHNLFPQTYVLHVHPALVNGMTCGVDGEKIATELFGEEAVWIPIFRPGYSLAVYCNEKMTEYKKASGKDLQLLFLQNHGIFFAADTIDEIDTMVKMVMNRLETRVTRKPDFTELPFDETTVSSIKNELSKASGGGYVLFDASKETLNFLENEQSAFVLIRPFSPDHIVYYGAYPAFVPSGFSASEIYEKVKTEKNTAPKLVLVQGVGAFILGADENDAKTAALLFRDAEKIAVYSEGFGGPLHMTDDLINFITNWEAESYRKKQNQ